MLLASAAALEMASTVLHLPNCCVQITSLHLVKVKKDELRQEKRVVISCRIVNDQCYQCAGAPCPSLAQINVSICPPDGNKCAKFALLKGTNVLDL